MRAGYSLKYWSEVLEDKRHLAFHILRNIADGLDGIDMVFDELGSEFLLSSLGHALESDSEDVLRQVSTKVS